MQSSRSDIAIVGIGCYLPGDADGPERLWSNLCNGVDGIVEVPADRWSVDKYFDRRSGIGAKAITKWGGFVRDIRGFDAELFGISPREAAAMDPQQRLALQIAWHALEDAGVAADRLAGSRTGVFLGVCGSDYGALQRMRGTSDALANTGSALSIVANRISHRLDLRGPSIVVDTACSSSLVALHFACRSMLDGDCDLALVGGVNALLDPGPFVGFSQANMMSPTGRMHSFDHRADGYVRAEGGSMVVLRPLDLARAAGDRIYAVVRGTCVNQDGHTSTMTAPSAQAQATMLRDACAAAGIEPATVAYVEAHGTGTPVGDPIEAQAIGEVFGRDRPDGSKVLVGSVKTNVGHLESAAGATGLVKAALAMYHGQVPKNLNFERFNPIIPVDELGIEVPQELTTLDPGHGPARAAVNSFGFGGTNACAVLEADSAAVVTAEQGSRPIRYLVPVTAATPTALRAVADRLIEHLDNHPTVPLDAIACNLAKRRAHLTQRLAIVAVDRDELRRKLALFVEGKEPAAAVKGELPPFVTGRREQRRPPVFVFTGQGGQWWAMGRALLAEDPLFRREIERFDSVFVPMSGWSVADELTRDEATSRINRTSVTQTAIFALQIALASRWRAWGIEPGLIVGHSFGELAAAHVAGAVSLEDAARIIYHRGRLQQGVEGTGGMAAIGLSRAEVEEALRDLDASVEIAAVNGPSMVTIGGSKQVLAAALAAIEQRWPGTFARMLKLEAGFHTGCMDPIEAEFRECLAGLRPSANSVPLVSTVTGELIDGETLDVDYWWRNVREPVLFQSAIELISAKGYDTFIEVGPHTTLAGPITSCLAEMGVKGLVVASQNRDQPELETLHMALGTLWVNGHSPDWEGVLGTSNAFFQLPRYPFEKKSYWTDSEESRAMLFDAPVHPLLGRRMTGAALRWVNELDLRAFPFIKDHRIDGSVLYPGAGYVEMMSAVAGDVLGDGLIELEDVVLHEAMFIDEEQTEQVETSLDTDRAIVRIHSRSRDGAPEWVLRASGRIAVRPLPANDLHTPIVAPPGDAPIDGHRFYEFAAGRGYQYGPRFQGVTALWPSPVAPMAMVVTPEELSGEAAPYRFHPAILDACLQVGFGMLLRSDGTSEPQEELSLPRKIGRVRVYGRPSATMQVSLRLVEHTDRETVSEFDVTDEDGKLLLSFERFEMRRLPRRHGVTSDGETAKLASYQDTWREAPLEDETSGEAVARHWLIFADAGGKMGALASSLAARGAALTIVERPADDQGPDGFIEIIDRAAASGGPLAMLFGWGLDAEVDSSRLVGDDVLALQQRGTLPALRLVQALAMRSDIDARLWVLTCGARHAVDSGVAGLSEPDILDLAQTPLAGLVRTVRTEHESLDCRLIDLDPRATADELDLVLAELLGDSDEPEVAFRDGRRLVSRLELLEPEAIPPKRVAVTSEAIASWKLTMRAAGVLDQMTVVETDRPSPEAGELLLDVRAVALNFRDIMAATGLLPEEAERGNAFEHLGTECAGTVLQVGYGVTGFAPGDRVMTMARGSFAAELAVPADLVMRVPAELDLAAASTIPVAFLTAYYSLVTQGRLEAGERVLIHVATGGVGLAAIQIAKMIGAEIFATAGSERKRDHLRALGIRHVMNSRTLDFADEVMAATDGRGVDVVLNSLPGAFLEKGLACLAPYGRFLELGKRDIYADSPIGLKALRKNLTFYAIDLANIDAAQRRRMRGVLGELEALIDSGRLAPLPYTAFPMSEVVDAFRFMSQAKHIGKVVVSLEDLDLQVALSADRPVRLDQEGAYLVTGGLGGFGLEVAKWLGANGARHLVLMGRSGAASEAAQTAIHDLEQAGVSVVVATADVTSAKEVTSVVDAARLRGRPLRGVIHGAMVIDDGFITQLDETRFMRVLGPKVAGAVNLHNATIGERLDFFVMFSSIAALLGSSGQGNYVAGNSFLDEFARYRQSLGLPALTVNWGALGGAGFVARTETIRRYLDTMGIVALTLEESLGGLGRMLRQDPGVLALVRIDWTKLARASSSMAASPRLSHLMATSSGGQGGGRARADILAAPASRREALVIAFLRQQIAKVLRVEAAKIEAARPLNELGLDSLTAFEVKNRVESELALSLPVSRFLQQPTVNSLAAAILEKLGEEGAADDSLSQADPREEDTGLSIQEAWLLGHLDRSPIRDAFVRLWDFTYAISVKPSVDESRLRTALADLTSRHEILRACFPKENGRRMLRILSEHPIGLEVYEHRDLDVNGARAILQARADEPFDLEHGPLMQLALYRLADDTDVLLFRLHHAIFDGWSLLRLVFQMFMTYFGLEEEDEPTLSHREFVELQRQIVASPEVQESLAYWREQVRDAGPKLPLPFARPRRKTSRDKGGAHRFFIEPQEVAELDELATRASVSSYALMLTGFKLTLYAYTGREDIIVPGSVSARYRRDLEPVIGWLANVLPFRSRIDPAGSVLDYLTTVANVVRDGLVHQAPPIHFMLPELDLGRRDLENPIVQVGFYMTRPDNFDDRGFGVLLVNSPDARVQFGSLEVTSVALTSGKCNRDLLMYIQEIDGRIYATIEYDADVLDQVTIEKFADDYLDVLREMVRAPYRSISETIERIDTSPQPTRHAAE